MNKNLISLQLDYLNLIERETKPKSIRVLAQNAKMNRGYVSDLLFKHDIDFYHRLNGLLNERQATLKQVLKHSEKLKELMPELLVEHPKGVRFIKLLKSGYRSKSAISKELNMTRQNLYNWLCQIGDVLRENNLI